MCSRPPPAICPGTAVRTFMTTYRSYGSEPQKRRCSLTIASRSFAALAPSNTPASPMFDEVMLLAVDRELVDRGIADQNRRIHQLVVVGGAIAVAAARQSGQRGHRRPPAARGLDDDLVRALHAAGERHERRRAIDHREVGFHPVGAHAHLARVDPVLHGHRRRAAGRDAPAVLVGLLDRERAAALAGRGHALDVPRVLANQVRARRPHRHHQLDLGPTVGRAPPRSPRSSASAARGSSRCTESLRAQSVRRKEESASGKRPATVRTFLRPYDAFYRIPFALQQMRVKQDAIPCIAWPV